MKKSLLTLSLLALTLSAITQPVRPLGKLQPFWRNHPVLGPFLQDGLWLCKVPDYFFDSSFPYQKRPYEKEVMFTDHLSVVRLLGGTDNFPGLKLDLAKGNGVNADGTMKKSKLHETDTASIRKLARYDFVYRKKDGTIGFRPELIKARLQPYLSNGYSSFTVVLDNVPWGLRKEPVIGGFGQVGPPDDPEEWYLTVKKLCETLKDILGGEKANQLRFRIGTEMNGTERFAGTQDQFIAHFDYAAAAIACVLPEARLSLFNISAATFENIRYAHHVNAFHVIEHESTGINRKTGKANQALPFIAASRYYCEKSDLNGIVGGINDIWNFIKDSIPGNKNFTREIHEYGAIADWNANPKTDNPDAFGNAMNLQVMLNLCANGIDKLFHWNMLERVVLKGYPEIYIPNGQLWGYSVLEYMAGGEAYFIVPECKEAENKTTYTALLSVFPENAFLLVNAFNTSRNKHEENTVELKIPKTAIGFRITNTKAAAQNNSNSIYYHIRQDIEKQGLLAPILAGRPEYTCNLKGMSNDPGKAQLMVAQNWDKYKSLWKNSLTLGKFQGNIREDGEFYLITIKMAAPESIIISMNQIKSAKIQPN